MTGRPWTPGPWTYQAEFDAMGEFRMWSVSSDTPDGHTVRANVDTEANARLVAHAPEMFEVLSGLLDTASDEYTDSWPWFKAALDLMPRILGEKP